MFKKAAIVAVALAGQAYVEAVAIQKRDGAHGHSHAAAPAASSGYAAPAASSGYAAPAASSGYGAPAAPSSGYGAPAPASSYGAPADSYGAPADSYGAPADSYGAPADTYGAPATGYDEPAGYGATGAAEAGGVGLLPFVAAIIAIIGLSLLFPTFVSLTSVRRKRSAEEANPMVDMAERINDIYGAVLESEDCMEKIACEIGGMAKDITSSPLVGTLVEPLVPAKYSKFYATFRNGKNCHMIKCGNH